MRCAEATLTGCSELIPHNGMQRHADSRDQNSVRRAKHDVRSHLLPPSIDADNPLGSSEFVPKLTRLLSDANLIHTLELFSDKLPKCRLLAFFSFPNVLDSLPKRMEALRSVHFATAAGQLCVTTCIASRILADEVEQAPL